MVDLYQEPRDQETKKSTSYKNHEVRAGFDADALIERYGDVMGVIDNWKPLEIVTRPVEQGGWGVWPQALTNAVKRHSDGGDLAVGLLKVWDAVQYTRNCRQARNRAAFLFSVLKNGKKALK